MELKRRARGCWGEGKGAGTAPSVRVTASLPLTPPNVPSAGLAGSRGSAQVGWLGSEAESSQGHKGGGGARRGRRQGERERARVLAEPQTKPAAGRRDAAPRSSGYSRDAGGGGRAKAGARQAYLNIRLRHARGAADNFITSADKNDCGRMQTAHPSRRLPQLQPASGGAPRSTASSAHPVSAPLPPGHRAVPPPLRAAAASPPRRRRPAGQPG